MDTAILVTTAQKCKVLVAIELVCHINQLMVPSVDIEVVVLAVMCIKVKVELKATTVHIVH